MGESTNPRGALTRTWWALAATAVAAGAAVRFLGARGDMWLDELWSLRLAQGLRSAADVFAAVHHDNNHHLNTLYLWAVGSGRPSLLYRLPAVLAGVVALVVAAWSQARRDAFVALAWLVLLAGSLLLIHYSSEARGYSPAILCALLCQGAMARLLADRRPAQALLFAALATAGLLCHLTFIYVLLACFAWAAMAPWGERAAPSRWWVLLLAFVPPAATLAALWVSDLRFLAVGGGPDYSLPAVLRELTRATLNVPAELFGVVALLCALTIVAELARLVLKRDPEWAFFAVVLVLGPGAVLVITRPSYVAPRYFAVAAPFALLLLARSLGRLRRWGRGGTVAASALLALFLGGSVPGVRRLLEDGRGRYREALAFLAANTPELVITVGGDHDFRNRMVVEYYGPAAAAPASFAYWPKGNWGGDAPRWYLVHRFTDDPEPPPLVRAGPTVRSYRLLRTFRGASLSGWDWFVYLLDDQPR